MSKAAVTPEISVIMAAHDDAPTLQVAIDSILPGCSDSLQAFAQGRAVVRTAGEKYLMRCR